MLLSESDAKFKYCPLLKTHDDKMKFCLGSMCMMWTEGGQGLGRCGLASSAAAALAFTAEGPQGPVCGDD